MNEMLLYAGFMNGVTSLFVSNLCSEQDNEVSGALAPPTKIVQFCTSIPPLRAILDIVNMLQNAIFQKNKKFVE